MIYSLVWNSLLMIHEYLFLFIIFTRKFDNSFPDKKISQKSLNNNRPQMMVVNNNNQHFDYHEKWLYFQKKMLHRTIYQTILQYWETFFYHFCTTTQRFSNSDSVPSSLRQDQYTALYTVGQNPHKNTIYKSGTASVSINVLEFLTKIFDFLACCTLVYCKYLFSLGFRYISLSQRDFIFQPFIYNFP